MRSCFTRHATAGLHTSRGVLRRSTLAVDGSRHRLRFDIRRGCGLTVCAPHTVCVCVCLRARLGSAEEDRGRDGSEEEEKGRMRAIMGVRSQAYAMSAGFRRRLSPASQPSAKGRFSFVCCAQPIRVPGSAESPLRARCKGPAPTLCGRTKSLHNLPSGTVAGLPGAGGRVWDVAVPEGHAVMTTLGAAPYEWCRRWNKYAHPPSAFLPLLRFGDVEGNPRASPALSAVG